MMLKNVSVIFYTFDYSLTTHDHIIQQSQQKIFSRRTYYNVFIGYW